MQHEEQRFRLSYVLGAWKSAPSVEEDEFRFDDEAEDASDIRDDEIVTVEEQIRNQAKLATYVTEIKQFAFRIRDKVKDDVRYPARRERVIWWTNQTHLKDCASVATSRSR